MEKLSQLRGQVRSKYLLFDQRYGRYIPASFFLLGFLFDIFTTDRIDQTWALLQQIVYLAIISTFLFFETVYLKKEFIESKWNRLLWRYRVEIVHFLFGSLLSLYTIFYFKSASLLSSTLFIGLMLIILVINELPAFQKLALQFKFVLLGLCILSFLNYFIPILLGFIGWVPFLISIFISLLIGLIFYLLLTRQTYKLEELKKLFLIPYGSIVAIFFFLYLIAVIPPVPLSLKYAGIYHEVKKENNQYLLYHEKPFWAFWRNGDQNYYARPGDKIILFIRIFSPTSFRDQIQVRWLKKEKGEWQLWDTVPINITGGRDEGFRGVVSKANYAPGEWQVRIDTTDKREIGRLGFEVIQDQEIEPREFKVDVH